MHPAGDPRAKERLGLLNQLQWLDVTTELADAARRSAATYLRSYPGVDTVDDLIAAGTTHLDATLLTLNLRHVPMFERLQPAY